MPRLLPTLRLVVLLRFSMLLPARAALRRH